MKILRLKLVEKFRSLPANFELKFPIRLINSKEDVETTLKPDFSNIDDSEPVCLVGVNGSGKSNILEALAEIFQSLNNFFLSNNKIDKNKSSINSFEIEYLLPITYGIGFLTYAGMEKFGTTYESKYLKIIVTKTENQNPVFNVEYNNVRDVVEGDPSIIPNKIIGYSSGQNEILSIPFFKSDYANFEYSKNNPKSDTDLFGKLKYMDYEESSIVFLTNYLLLENDDLNTFKKHIGIEDIDSFDIEINTKYRNKKNIELGGQLKKLVDFLEQSSFNKKTITKYKTIYKFSITQQLKEQFKQYFIDTDGLYRVFREFGILNLNAIPKYKINEILRSDDEFYKNYRIAEFEPERKLFSISNLKIRKTNISNPINYRNLSDGEHQFLYILGILKMLKKQTCLFLLDEPETHFNPQWKYEFSEILKECITKSKSQIILTTHDPVLLSGLRKENVLIFRKPDDPLPRTFFPDKDLKGMGVDAILMSEIFGFDSTMDYNTKLEIIEMRSLQLKMQNEVLSRVEFLRYDKLYEKLKDIDFAKPLNDPMYRDFLKAKESLGVYSKPFLTEEEEMKREQISKQILEKIKEKYNQ